MSEEAQPVAGQLRAYLPGLRDRLAHWRTLLDRPLTSYYLVLGCTLLLLALGLVIVLSASTAWQLVLRRIDLLDLREAGASGPSSASR